MIQTIWLKAIVERKDQSVYLTEAEFSQIPSHFLSCTECEFKIFKIEFQPGNKEVNREKVIKVYLKALKRKYKILKSEVITDLNHISESDIKIV
jgi:hypothetical protein